MTKEKFVGATLEVALEHASKELGVARGDLEHTVLEEERDFWGVGGDSVTIEAWVGAAVSDPVATQESKSEAEPVGLVAEARGAEEPASGSPGGGFWRDENSPVPDAAEEESTGNAANEEVLGREVSTTDAAATLEEQGSGRAPTSAPDSEGLTVETPSEADADAGTEGVETEVIVNLLTQIFHDMELACVVEIEPQPNGFLATITGDDKEALLEGNGRSLSALELITNNAFRHKLPRGHKVRVDAGDFRKGRDEELSDLAFQVAHSAKESGRTQETQPLNPYERRLVHLALAEDAGVSTLSRGSGFLKTVQVIPQKNERGNRGGRRNRGGGRNSGDRGGQHR